MNYFTDDIFSRLHIDIPTDLPTADTHDDCTHETTLFEKGVVMCTQCGVEISDDDDKSDCSIAKQHRAAENDHCYSRQLKDKSIYADVQNIDIGENIKDLANEIYIETCKNKVHRGTRRKAIVFAAVFHAYKLVNKPHSCESLIKVFNIRRKDALKGLKFINENLSKQSLIRTVYITPEHLIYEFLENFHISADKTHEIIKLYRSIQNRSSLLNRSRPQSVASGVIWYWLSTNNYTHIYIKDFVSKVGLSELTVLKISREVSKLIHLRLEKNQE